MNPVRIEQRLAVAALATLISGCSTWIGPQVAVEDRTVPPVEGVKAIHARIAPARIAAKPAVLVEKQRAARSLCNEYADSLIHPVHFGAAGRPGEDGQCPLLSWEIRMVRDEALAVSSPR